jgi:hypothetical protein
MAKPLGYKTPVPSDHQSILVQITLSLKPQLAIKHQRLLQSQSISSTTKYITEKHKQMKKLGLLKKKE